MVASNLAAGVAQAAPAYRPVRGSATRSDRLVKAVGVVLLPGFAGSFPRPPGQAICVDNALRLG
jgi:hypothetical protein